MQLLKQLDFSADSLLLTWPKMSDTRHSTRFLHLWYPASISFILFYFLSYYLI